MNAIAIKVCNMIEIIFITIPEVASLLFSRFELVRTTKTALIVANTKPDLIAPIVVGANGTNNNSTIPNASESISIVSILSMFQRLYNPQAAF